jgi:DNA-binding MarR family transcriptional regulator
MDERGTGLRGNGDFFAIDRRVWAHVCNLGLTPAIAYLVMARGSGRDNRTTAWSVNAIEKYTGIGRPRAKMAIKILEEKGIVRGDHTNQTKPRYSLTPAHEIPGCDLIHPPIF